MNTMNRYRRWAMLGLALGMMGCAAESNEDSSAVALEMIGDTLDAMEAGPPSAATEVMHGRSVAALARRCDPEPWVSTTSRCGRNLPALAYAWEDCAIAAGPEAPAELNGASASGSVETWVEVDDDAPCGPAAGLRHVSFLVEGSLP